MAETVKELDKLIREQEKYLQTLQARKARLEAQKFTPEQELAIELHKKFCRHNHTDGCSWYYEIDKDVHNWNDRSYSAHMEWLVKAKKVIDAGISPENFYKLMEIV